METKTKTVPFEVELAKKITAGEVAGKIKTRSGRDVKIIAFNRMSDSSYPILYLAQTGEWESVTKDGEANRYMPDESPADLVIELPVEAGITGINSSGFPLFKPFDRVLVRDSDKDPWTIDIFIKFMKLMRRSYMCFTSFWCQCIPYEGNERLFNTTDVPEKQEDEV